MPHCDIVALIPRADRPDILVRTDGPSSLTLPTTTIDGVFETETGLDAIAAVLGELPPVLRIGNRLPGPDGEATLVTIETEPLAESPAGFAWVEATRLLDDAEAPVWIRDVLPRWIERQADGPGPDEPPWAQRGWFGRASGWMVERLEALGIPSLAPPRLVYGWGISMVLRAPTAAGDLYLKATSAIFAREAVLTEALARVTPDLVTRVAAIEPDEGWLLMYDLAGPPLGDTPEAGWSAGLETYGRIQLAWSGRAAELTAAGAETRSLADLAARAPTLADHDPLHAELSADERALWREAVPALQAACARLDALGPAPTISHGDLHPWNVAVTPDGPRVFDWSDAAIAHPFLDLAVFLTRSPDVDRRREIRDAYLAPWREVLDPAALAEAGELAIAVGSLYQVESYRRILTGLTEDDRGGMEGAARSWALATVAALRDGIAVQRIGHADG